jgi:hypothetical protein
MFHSVVPVFAVAFIEFIVWGGRVGVVVDILGYT